jgi:hypothetical protein
MPSFATTLAAAVDATQAKILVDDAAATDGGFYVQIDAEYLLVERGGSKVRGFPNTSTTRVEWQVQRGVLGSVAAAHDDEADVTEVVLTVGTSDPVDPPATGAQSIDADLTAIGALTSAANKVPYATGAGTWALADLSAAGRALIDDANAGAQLTTLGVSAFAQTVLDDADAAAVLATIGAYAPPSVPEVPATPSEQDIVDALVTLGLITQAAP